MMLGNHLPGLVTNSILFCWLFTIKDRCYNLAGFFTNTQSRCASVVFDGVFFSVLAQILCLGKKVRLFKEIAMDYLRKIGIFGLKFLIFSCLNQKIINYIGESTIHK